MVLVVISTDIKKYSYLWNKSAEDMMEKLPLHHAILKVNFKQFNFDICPSSPEGDAFIASQRFNNKDEAIRKLQNCLQIITSTFVWCRKHGKLNIGKQDEQEEYKNKIHIRIGVAVGEPDNSEALSHVPTSVNERGERCSLKETVFICSNNIVSKSEQAEIRCSNWINHYCLWTDGLFEQHTSDIIADAEFYWKRANEHIVIPKTVKKTGMVLFLSSGKLTKIICTVKSLCRLGWISVKITRNKSAMLILNNIDVNTAIREFDWLTETTNLVVSAGYGDFTIILNKRAACYAPDAFGDIINGSARMHNSMCILNKKYKPKVKLQNISREELNLGKGEIWVYRSRLSSSSCLKF